MDGEHSIDESYHVTDRMLQALYTELFDQRVVREGSLLKTNMVVSGYECVRAGGHRHGCRARRSSA